jgi:hypothetical protein
MAKRVSKSSSPSHPRHRGPAIDEESLLSLARKITQATGEPVIGGVAVILHGGGRATSDIDLLSSDLWLTHQKLEAAGILWDSEQREHRAGNVAVHMVDLDQFGIEVRRISTIKGVRVIGLADLIASKLTLGLKDATRSKDLAHVIDLIERVPLDKAFAGKLPTKLRAAFKRLVDEVHEPRRTTVPRRQHDRGLDAMSARSFYTTFGSSRLKKFASEVMT